MDERADDRTIGQALDDQTDEERGEWTGLRDKERKHIAWYIRRTEMGGRGSFHFSKLND